MNQQSERVQFRSSPEWIDLIQQLKEMTGISSRSELLRHALKAYKWAVKHTKKGHEVIAIGEDGVPHVLALAVLPSGDGETKEG